MLITGVCCLGAGFLCISVGENSAMVGVDLMR